MKVAYFLIAGFSGYGITKDSVYNLSTGKVVKPNKDGDVKLTASETIEGETEEGKPYTYALADLLAIGAGDVNWITPEGVAAPAAEGEPAAEPTEKEIFTARKKELETIVKQKRDFLLTVDLNDTNALVEARSAFDSAKAILDEHIATKQPVVSEAQKEAQAAYDIALNNYNGHKELMVDAKAELEAAADKLKAEGGKPSKIKGGKGDANPDKAPKFEYADAQNIREMYAQGRYGNPMPEGREKAYSPSEIAEKFGCSTAAVGYMVNYLQHKLKKGDTAHTPLINEYYPALDSEHNETGTNGAPHVEDGIVETPQKYIKAGNRKGAAVKKEA